MMVHGSHKAYHITGVPVMNHTHVMSLRQAENVICWVSLTATLYAIRKKQKASTKLNALVSHP